MSGTVALSVHTLESLGLPITTSADPTGAVPEFAVSAVGASGPGTFADGSWNGAWNATTQRTAAVTPTIGGSGGGLTVTADTTYDLWVRVTVGTEIAVWRVGKLIVT